MSKPVQRRKARPVDQRKAKRIILNFGQKTVVLAIQPWLLTSAVSCLLLLAFFNVGAAVYLFKRDGLLTQRATQEIAIRQTYEAKFRRFRTAMEMVQDASSEERARLAMELAELSVRQDQYASRHARVAAVIDNARRMGIQVASVSAPMPMTKPENAPILADSGISLTGDESAIGGENEPIDNGVLKMPNTFEEFEQESSVNDPFLQIERFEADLQAMDQINAVSVQAVAMAITKEHKAYRKALADLPIKLQLPAKASGIGGPFIPAEFDEKAIKATSKRIDTQLKDISRLRKISASLPIAVPLKNAVRSSSFGRRIDPFRKRAAFHAGVDFRAKTGTPVLATADGQVLRAGRAGGYGNLIEIRHAHGLTTRFGHLSRISVKAGQSVKRGDVIGKVGSTGRSTGPHLHYEVRSKGQARNPQPFMNAGKHLSKL